MLECKLRLPNQKEDVLTNIWTVSIGLQKAEFVKGEIIRVYKKKYITIGCSINNW